MTILITIIMVVTIWHWVMDGIWAPSARWEIRLKLFRLRDELRSLKMSLGEEFKDEEFEAMEGIINNGIQAANYLDVEALARFGIELKKRPELAQRIERRRELVRNCPHGQAIEIMKRYTATCTEMVIWNHAGWAIYLVPITLIFAAKSYGEKLMQKFLSAPEVEIGKLVPQAS